MSNHVKSFSCAAVSRSCTPSPLEVAGAQAALWQSPSTGLPLVIGQQGPEQSRSSCAYTVLKSGPRCRPQLPVPCSMPQSSALDGLRVKSESLQLPLGKCHH